jgi:hypothetical protein
MQRLITVYYDDIDEDYKVVEDYYFDLLIMGEIKKTEKNYWLAEHATCVVGAVEAWGAETMQLSRDK